MATSGAPAAGAGLMDYPALFRQLAGLAPVPVIIVLDPANLLSPETVPRQSEILAEAADLLGPRSEWRRRHA